jgi:hypothetical protein
MPAANFSYPQARPRVLGVVFGVHLSARSCNCQTQPGDGYSLQCFLLVKNSGII